MAFTWQSAGHAFASLFKDVVTVSKKVITALGGLQDEEKLIESLTSLVSPQAAAVEQIAFGALGALVAAVQATETAAGANGINVAFDASVVVEVRKVEVREMVDGHVANEGAANFVIACTSVQPTEEEKHLQERGKADDDPIRIHGGTARG